MKPSPINADFEEESAKKFLTNGMQLLKLSKSLKAKKLMVKVQFFPMALLYEGKYGNYKNSRKRLTKSFF